MSLHRRALVVLHVVPLVLVACGGPGVEEETRLAAMPDSGVSTLQKDDLTVGPGSEARRGMIVRVHYTGWLYDASAPGHKGDQFDTSRDRGEPFEFRLGAGEVIAGWDEGVAGMSVGGTRRLTVPPSMGYGARGAGGVIPPNATLLFEVELLDVR